MRKCLLALTSIAVGLLSLTSSAQEKPKPIKALLVLGGCCHDYAKQKDILAKGLAERANVEVTLAFDDINKDKKGRERVSPVYEKADWAANYDVVIHDECSASVKDEAQIETILKPHKDGLPGVLLHCGMHNYRSKGSPKATPWFEFTGLVSTGHGAQLPIAIN